MAFLTLRSITLTLALMVINAALIKAEKDAAHNMSEKRVGQQVAHSPGPSCTPSRVGRQAKVPVANLPLVRSGTTLLPTLLPCHYIYVHDSI